MDNQKVLSALTRLGQKVSAFIDFNDLNTEIEPTAYLDFYKSIRLAQMHNQWFTSDNCIRAFKGIACMLNEPALSSWQQSYAFDTHQPKRVGIIMAGNIPMVGFHDMLCVLLSGNSAVVKMASADKVLMQFIIDELISENDVLKSRIEITERLNNVDAVIATGSNNSSRYFEYYFGKIPHIIRRNRNSIAILSGNETDNELKELSHDIFAYFGLGCRNVSKLYVPEGYNFHRFFEAMLTYGHAMDHNKYMNNYDYHNAIYLLNSQQFLTNNFVIVKEDKPLATPVSVLNYEFYFDANVLAENLLNGYSNDIKNTNLIQCIASNMDLPVKTVPLGQTQFPAVNDYADGVDTMAFLKSLI